MEYLKTGSYERNFHSKLSPSQERRSTKISHKNSAKKNKSNPTSLEKKSKPVFAMNKYHKKGNQNQIQKKSLLMGRESPQFSSYLATPFEQSFDKGIWKKSQIQLKSIKMAQILPRASKINNETTKCVKINFFLKNKKMFSKQFAENICVEEVKEAMRKKLKQKHQQYQPLSRVIGIRTLENNYAIDVLLRKKTTKICELMKENLEQINVRIMKGKKIHNYNELELGDFELLKYLGNGGFSTVYLARCKVDGLICALKMIRKSSILSEKKYQMLENQKNILFSTDHPRLVDLYYAFESQNCIIFGLEFCPNGNLFQLMRQKIYFSEEEAKFIFQQILQGVKYIHSQNILFRDIKLENILFDCKGNIKITDFGLSKPDFHEKQITYSYCGSPEYMAPEMLSKSGHSLAIDYYALGILLYELLVGKSPFYAPHKEEIFHAIINQKPAFPSNPHLSKEVKSLILGLLQKNPRHRIGSLKGIDEILSHPWLRNYIPPISSPFKVPLKEQKIDLQEEPKKLKVQFEKDLLKEKFKKIFFPKSFVNKNLMEQLAEIYSENLTYERQKKKNNQ